jgi:sugar lactone lactonase YvrE
MLKPVLAVTAVLVASATSGPAAAEALYGVGGNGSNSPGALFSVSETTGVNTLIADPVTPGGLSGAAFDSTGRLFGSTIAGQGTTSSLVEIDPETGSLSSTVGAITVSGGGPAISIGDLAFQPQTDVLFGLRSNADLGESAGEIYTIDVTSAVATLVGTSTPTSSGGLAFAPDGTFYRSGKFGIPLTKLIAILDPTDASTLQTFSSFITIFFDGLAVRPSDGLLFATGGATGVHTIDLGTSTQTTLSPGPQNGDTMSDLDFIPPTPVPALSGGGLALLAWVVCVLACGFAARRSGGVDDSARV